MALMDTAWRCRLMIFGVVSLLLVGDLFGYGGYSVRGVKSDHPDEVVGVQARAGSPTGPASAAAGKFQQKNAEIEIGEGEWHFQVFFFFLLFCAIQLKHFAGFLSFCLAVFLHFLFISCFVIHKALCTHCKICITFACLYEVSLCLVASRSISIYRWTQGAAKALQTCGQHVW